MLLNRSTATALPAGDRNAALTTAEIFYGDALDCDGVFADVDNNITRAPAGKGSVYLSRGAATTPGAMYFKAGNGGTSADWLLIAMAPCQPQPPG